ncbi:hypothetical protein JQ615_11945 [Bradyrhizobium jicamae]|uniref:HdeA/HdeB family protein n=1 Tax=Bradyrhizobium jicamae TaxID=280332 RepID=A0ABS5FH40_9BRAD|nr:HdeA/HdeB family chaperone [Bradyrhizobium jicamae]MBR0796102.1 hypothetical protein [Bradyrhizobium jicamae]MBR0935717.1 hypothetical protein [Bradyrhizobium jicamae]
MALLVTLLCTSLAEAQVTIEVAKITCRQFAGGEIGQPRNVAAWLSGYYHGKKNSTSLDKQAFEDNLTRLMNFCRKGDNGKILVLKAIEQISGTP